MSYAQIKRQFNCGCTEFRLLEDGDRILVALSGGKDSLMLTRLLAERRRIFRPAISVEAAHVVMDNIPYETERGYLERFCSELGVRLTVLHTRFEDRGDRKSKSPCLLCSRYRRKALFDFAAGEGFNKVALGHHQDDLLVTLLMNMNYEGRIDTMRSRVDMEHYPLTIIRPLCRVREELISAEAEAQGFAGMKAVCPYDRETHRQTMTHLLRQMEALNPEARHNLWRCLFR